MRGRRSATGKAQEIFWLKQVARQACLAPTISKSENFLQRSMWQLIRPRNRFTYAIFGLSLISKINLLKDPVNPVILSKGFYVFVFTLPFRCFRQARGNKDIMIYHRTKNA